jgi:hypothetical protein
MKKITFNRQRAAVNVLALPDAQKYGYRYAVEIKFPAMTLLLGFPDVATAFDFVKKADDTWKFIYQWDKEYWTDY